MPLPLSLSVRTESWPIAGAFSISRGAKTEAQVVVAELSDGRHSGRGECVPYARYDETVKGVMAALGAMSNRLALGLDRDALQQAMPAGAARNALDCAFWDLECQARPQARLRARGAARAEAVDHRLHDLARHRRGDGGRRGKSLGARRCSRSSSAARAISNGSRRCGPRRRNSELIVDANEGWTPDNLAANLAACASAGVTLVEQPLPADADVALAYIKRPIPVCADESVHDRASLAALAGRYDAVNIKLDKAGGLTEALAMAAEARDGSASPSWSAAWWRPRSPWRRRCWWRSGRAWSISTGRCCSPRTAPTGCATMAAWSIRRPRPCGADPC